MAAMVISMPETEAAWVSALFVTRTGSMTPAFEQIAELVGKAVVTKSAFLFRDLFRNHIALFAAIVRNRDRRCKSGLRMISTPII